MTLPTLVFVLLVVMAIFFVFVDLAKTIVIVGFLICNAMFVTGIISFLVLLVISVTMFISV
jgi:hypothetical protein